MVLCVGIEGPKEGTEVKHSNKSSKSHVVTEGREYSDNHNN